MRKKKPERKASTGTGSKTNKPRAEATVMRVGYSKGIGITLIALGVFVVVVSSQAFSLFSMGLLLLMGINLLRKTYFEVSEGKLVVFAQLGPAKERHEGELRLEHGRIWAGQKKTPVRRWMADGATWDKAIEKVGIAPKPVG